MKNKNEIKIETIDFPYLLKINIGNKSPKVVKDDFLCALVKILEQRIVDHKLMSHAFGIQDKHLYWMLTLSKNNLSEVQRSFSCVFDSAPEFTLISSSICFKNISEVLFATLAQRGFGKFSFSTLFSPHERFISKLQSSDYERLLSLFAGTDFYKHSLTNLFAHRVVTHQSFKMKAPIHISTHINQNENPNMEVLNAQKTNH